MAQLQIPDVPDDVVRRLAERADRHGRDLSEELRAILTAAAAPPHERLRDEAERLARETAGRHATDTVVLLREGAP